MRKLFLVITILCAFVGSSLAQEKFSLKDSGFLQTEVYDREGNAYSIDDLRFTEKKLGQYLPLVRLEYFDCILMMLEQTEVLMIQQMGNNEQT